MSEKYPRQNRNGERPVTFGRRYHCDTRGKPSPHPPPASFPSNGHSGSDISSIDCSESHLGRKHGCTLRLKKNIGGWLHRFHARRPWVRSRRNRSAAHTFPCWPSNGFADTPNKRSHSQSRRLGPLGRRSGCSRLAAALVFLGCFVLAGGRTTDCALYSSATHNAVDLIFTSYSYNLYSTQKLKMCFVYFPRLGRRPFLLPPKQ